MTLAAGTRLGPYEIVGPIGAGGMGEVYRAIDTRLGRSVAIKVLAAQRTTPEDRARFEREARAIAALSHPHICTLHDVGEFESSLFLVMEHLEGQTLGARLRAGPLPVRDAVETAVEIASAVAAAHAAGIVHRDLKPGNVMLTAAGAKLLDFGLARSVVAYDGAAATRTAAMTLAGTPAYMAPEQWEGGEIDGRADVWALGVVLFEMLTGRHPFFADAAAATPFSPGAGNAPTLRTAGVNAPPSLARVVERALRPDRHERYVSMAGMLGDLVACRDDLAAAAQPSSWKRAAARARRPAVAASLVTLVLLASTAGAWGLRHAGRVRAARARVPEISQLAQQDRVLDAFVLARQLDDVIPSDAALKKAWNQIALDGTIESRPPGVEVYVKPYQDLKGDWIHLGRTPLRNVRLPNRGLLRVRAEAPGYAPLLAARTAAMLLGSSRGPAGAAPDGVPVGIDLAPSGSPDRMVRIPAVRAFTPVVFHGFPTPPAVDLAEYWLDTFEVTNAEFKRFVDAGGYERSEYWPPSIVRAGRPITLRDALALFVDKTGRPGPATWELGTFPAEKADLPVSGVSWYEAAAYAAFAGKQLPTLYHWIRAAGVSQAPEILPLSNVRGSSPHGGLVPGGTTGGVTAWGAFDMAGNVKEWCANEAGGGTRVVLGGAWDEPDYMFHTSDARDPLRRDENVGFRCVRYPREGTSPTAATWVPRLPRPYVGLSPVDDRAFAIYRAMYAYDRTPLDARIERTGGEGNAAWRWEKVSYASPAGEAERIPAYVFLPRGSAPPYQAVVFFPGSTATVLRSSDAVPDRPDVDWLVRSGRALIFPIYKETYERGTASSLLGHMPSGSAASRDLQVQLAREVSRTVDYLESRADIDPSRIAYYGLSWGAALAPLPLALDTRFKTAVLVSGGLLWVQVRPEADAVNFLPRVRLPVLMLNGGHDMFYTPPAQQTFFDLLGTPTALKQKVTYPESGHTVPRYASIAETLRWLDAQLGDVKKQ